MFFSKVEKLRKYFDNFVIRKDIHEEYIQKVTKLDPISFDDKEIHLNKRENYSLKVNGSFSSINLKIEATSNSKIHAVLTEVGLRINWSIVSVTKVSVGVYMRDDNITTRSGIISLHPTKRNYWVASIDDFFSLLLLSPST